MAKVTFIGLGAMGSRMAGRLLAANHQVTVFNRTVKAAEALQAAGAEVASSPRDAVRGAEIVISMVRDEAAARHVWLDSADGALSGLERGAIAIESSTVTPAWIATLCGALLDRGVHTLDAPVVGSRPQAEAGQLVFLVGGESANLDDAAFGPVRAVLEAMGKVVIAGASGTGAALKLAVNALFGIQVVALAEVVAMLARSGVGRPKSLELLGAMPITSPALARIAGLMAAEKYAPNFPIDLVAKDFGYVVQAAEAVGANVPTARAVAGVFDAASKTGLGENDIAGIAPWFDGR